MIKIKHSGALGDIIYALPFIKALGDDISFYVGEHTFINNEVNEYNSQQNIDFINSLFVDNKKSVCEGYSNFKMIERLLLSQPYIKEVHNLENDTEVDFDIDKFRGSWNSSDHISDMVLKFFKMLPGVWHNQLILENIPVNLMYRNCFICSRSFRYRSASGTENWRNIFKSAQEQTGLKPIFLGIDSEHLDFVEKIGPIEHVKTTDLYDVAVIINSCNMGIYNGSSPLAIAQMLNKTQYIEGAFEGYINSVKSNLPNQNLFP